MEVGDKVYVRPDAFAPNSDLTWLNGLEGRVVTVVRSTSIRGSETGYIAFENDPDPEAARSGRFFRDTDLEVHSWGYCASCDQLVRGLESDYLCATCRNA